MLKQAKNQAETEENQAESTLKLRKITGSACFPWFQLGFPRFQRGFRFVSAWWLAAMPEEHQGPVQEAEG